jgi:hypothetical protein
MPLMAHPHADGAAALGVCEPACVAVVPVGHTHWQKRMVIHLEDCLAHTRVRRAGTIPQLLMLCVGRKWQASNPTQDLPVLLHKAVPRVTKAAAPHCRS